MEFKNTLVGSFEARLLAQSEPADLAVRFAIIDAINTAIDANAFTATVSVSAVSVLIRTVLCDELQQMGYKVDGTTTPGSFIITW